VKRNKVNKAVKTVQDLVDELTRPDNMTLEEYDEFLDEIGGDIDGRERTHRVRGYSV